MERISRMLRSGLALMLALCMIISACPVVAFANEAEINYVSIGDSMAMPFSEARVFSWSVMAARISSREEWSSC